MPEKSRTSATRSKDPSAELRRKLKECGAALKQRDAELKKRDAELEEAREQQVVVSEILRVIGSSSNDAQPVFEAIVRSGAHLFGGVDVSLRLVKGNHLETVASTKPIPASGGEFQAPLNDDRYMTSRSIRSRQVLHIPDVDTEEWLSAQSRQRARARGYRAVIHAPMLRGDEAIGTVVLTRPTPGPFTEKQIALLKTFADQAVIAIENVRLFNETNEALQQQTVIGEILRIISSSPTDTQPVFDAIVKSGVQLFGGMTMTLRLIRGEHTVTVAATTPIREETGGEWPVALSDMSATPSRAIARREVTQVEDILAAHSVGPLSRKRGELRGFRAVMCAPMLREGKAIGTVNVTRATPGAFTDKQIALLQTFADQAVIAIENARLFNETKEALERQMATSEILGVIASSPTDVQPVLDTVIRSAVTLAGATKGHIRQIDGELLRIVAHYNESPEHLERMRSNPLRVSESLLGRSFAERKPVHLLDARDGIPGVGAAFTESLGVRTILVVPLLREGVPIGGMTIWREVVKAFSEQQIDLVRAFAAQAVIAIENVRLINEIQDKSGQLEIANRHKSEFLASMSHELRTPLNAVIGFSEVLQQGMAGELNDKQSEYIKYIHTSGSHLLSLINDILDLSKVEAGRMELELADFNVPLAIDNALALIRERASDHAIALECTIGAGVADIHGDERKFKQVMLNLLSNAVKFTPDGGRITVAARPLNDTVEVSVTDTGIGIAPEDCDAVFDEFRQVGRHAEGKSEGTGLGLALTRKFIELHGGKIWLTSTLGQGSTFSFTLPRDARGQSSTHG